MSRISRKKVQHETLSRIHERLATEVAAINSTKEASVFLSELLGKEEQVLLAKRLVAIAMLAEGLTAYRIAQVLGMSTSTVNKLRVRQQLGHFDNILSFYRKKKQRQRFWKDVEVLLQLGMPSRGRDRWKFIEASEALRRAK